MSFNSKHGDNSNADESNAKTKAKVDRVYNNYNLFFILERELLLQSNNAGSASASSLSSSKNNGNGVRIPNEDYTDLTIPPLPSRYASLTLPPHWYVHGERQKRQHKKSHGVVSFREMAALIANYWKSVDGETLAFLEAVSKVLKQRQEEIRKRKAEEQDQKTPASSSRRRRLSVQTDVCDEEEACDEEDQKMPSSNYGYEYDTSRYFSSDGMTRRASNVYDAYGRSHSAESYGYYQHHRQLHRHQERDMSYDSHSYEWPHPHSAHGSMSNGFETSLSQSGSGVSSSGVNECPLGMNADIASSSSWYASHGRLEDNRSRTAYDDSYNTSYHRYRPSSLSALRYTFGYQQEFTSTSDVASSSAQQEQQQQQLDSSLPFDSLFSGTSFDATRIGGGVTNEASDASPVAAAAAAATSNASLPEAQVAMEDDYIISLWTRGMSSDTTQSNSKDTIN